MRLAEAFGVLKEIPKMNILVVSKTNFFKSKIKKKKKKTFKKKGFNNKKIKKLKPKIIFSHIRLEN